MEVSDFFELLGRKRLEDGLSEDRELLETMLYVFCTDDDSHSRAPFTWHHLTYSYEPIENEWSVQLDENGNVEICVENTNEANGLRLFQELEYKFRTESRYRDLLKEGPFCG